MISHALTIVTNELQQHLDAVYGVVPQLVVGIGNIAEGVGAVANGAGVPRDAISLSMVNLKEDKALKNLPNYVRNDTRLTVTYENAPVFLNLQLLLVATHTNYADALLAVSRVIRFFQHQHVFTQDSVAPLSLARNAPLNALDQLTQFKLIFDLYSANMEEINHLWGTLGGKQYPFVMYAMRLSLIHISEPTRPY